MRLLEPHVRLLATLEYLATGTFPFVGGAQVEARFSDAENSMNQWAANAATKMASGTSGSAAP